MDARYMVNHIKSEEQNILDGLCTTAGRYFNSPYQTDSYSALNQKCLKRNYDQMASPFCGPGQMMLNDGCFPKPLSHQQPLQYRQPYSIPIVGGASLSAEMQHLVQEPKFPPQTFDIPDIQDSNSVFGSGGGGGGAFDPATFGNYSTVVPSAMLSDHQPSYNFYGPRTPDHSQCGPPLVSAFPTWQSRVVSSNGSTTSSPVSQADETTVAAAAAETTCSVPTPQQVQITAKNNGFTAASHSTISRLPNKKARSPKRRKRKDPNEPQKPVSAYSLFFRNAQAAIKSQNPSATFGDVSKIVASMWDGLDDDVKNFYKRQMEVAKKEYLKQLAIYRATLVSKDVQGKTGTDTEAGISPQHPVPPPPPPPPPSSSAPAQTPSSQKVEDGVGLGLSPIPGPLCMPSSAYQSQNPSSPVGEPMGRMMSPPAAGHPRASPLFYPDGNQCLQLRYSSPSDVSVMRNNFLSYGQKLDHESIMSGLPEPGPYFRGMGPEAGFKSREYNISVGNNIVNGLCREIRGRSFVETDGSDQKLT